MERLARALALVQCTPPMTSPNANIMSLSVAVVMVVRGCGSIPIAMMISHMALQEADARRHLVAAVFLLLGSAAMTMRRCWNVIWRPLGGGVQRQALVGGRRPRRGMVAHRGVVGARLVGDVLRGKERKVEDLIEWRACRGDRV